jgi:pyrimidine operon attenuation protein / uracil phosphoribosyltransferase
MSRTLRKDIHMQLDAENLIDVLVQKIASPDPRTVVIGIHTGGAWVAQRLAARLGLTEVGTLAVTLHRDDFAQRGLHPQKHATDIASSIEGRNVLLVDDVLQSGRTIRAALNELYDFGRPARVALAVLVDRGGRELPIEAQYVAMTMPLSADQSLNLSQTDGQLRFDIHSR